MVLVVLSLIAAACSKPKKEAKTSSGPTTTNLNQLVTPTSSAPGTSVVTTPGGKPKAGSKSVAGGTTTGATAATSPAAPVGDQAQALRVGLKVFPVTTQRRQPYYLGVGDKTIKLVFSTDKAVCGVNALTALQAAGGALPSGDRFTRPFPTTSDQVEADSREAISFVVKYFNEHGFDTAKYLPHIRPLMGNDPANQIFGRHFEFQMIDGGSFQCPDKTTAAAKEAAETDHAFSVFTNLLDADVGYNMASALSAEPSSARPLMFGTEWLPDSIYNRFAPFVWTPWATGSTVVSQWATYVCTKLRGQNASRSPDATLKLQKRVFGLVHPNLKEVNDLASEFKTDLTRRAAARTPSSRRSPTRPTSRRPRPTPPTRSCSSRQPASPVS